MFYKFFRIAINFLVKEKLLLILSITYIALLFTDPSLLRSTLSFLNIKVLSVIVALLIISRGIELSGIFNRLSLKLISLLHGSTVALILTLILLSELTAMVVMNDTALFIYLPFIITLSKLTNLSLERFAIMVTIAVNVGSALTPIGNPQNVIIWQHYNVGFLEFIKYMAPFVVVSTVTLMVLAYFTFKNEGLRMLNHIPPVRFDRRLFYISATLLILNVIFAQLGFQIYALALTILSFLAVKRKIITTIDYGLILTFSLMFIDFGEISKLIGFYGLIPKLNTDVNTLLTSAFLSQLISNVPATITLINHVSLWGPLALGVNIGGVGLIIGSMANIITLRLIKLKLTKFHKYSLPYFALLTMIFTAMFILHLYPS